MKDYVKISDIIISSENYEAHIYSLNEDVDKKIAAFKKLDDSLSIKTNTIWVDQPFYNYLKGEYK
jgi:hypothetical protein